VPTSGTTVTPTGHVRTWGEQYRRDGRRVDGGGYLQLPLLLVAAGVAALVRLGITARP
jgi:hypothetical protein